MWGNAVIRRAAWFATFVTAAILCLFIARSVPPEEGGLMPAGLLVVTVAALALRRRTLPRSGRIV